MIKLTSSAKLLLLMGNSSSQTTSRRRSPRTQRTAATTRQQSYGSRKRRWTSALPRDPSTGRYLPRQSRASSPREVPVVRTRASSPRAKVASPRRRVEVEVIDTPQIEDVQVRSPRKPRCRSPVAEKKAASPRRAASPVAVKQVAVKAPRRKAPQMEAEAEAPEKRAPILRSSYTRARSASPVASESPPNVTAQRSPVSRREYASPSLVMERASSQEESSATIGPSTKRQIRKMATVTPVSEIAMEAPESLPTSTLPRQVEKLAHSAPKAANPTDLLFSYLNAA